MTIDPDNGNRQPATVVIVDTDANGELHVNADWAKAFNAPYRLDGIDWTVSGFNR